jgi:hypothetical protein
MRFFLLILLFLSNTNIYNQVKGYTPVKVTITPKVDGKLDDAAWNNLPIVNDFITAFPDFGKPATQKTEVKIIYDDVAVYVAAVLYDDPKAIRKQLTQRDIIDRQDVDNFTVSFDTYQDRQNGFTFQVTAAGVQGDARQSGNNFDRSWDAVWESAVSFNEQGWMVEIKIPFSAIRFAKKENQNWGLQIGRFLRKPNLNITWSPQDPNKDGTINQWGNLNGLKNIVPPLRLSFLPYISGGYRNAPTNNGSKTEFLKSGGMDVKWGINESFTVDMTLIPDFAQVQSDNVILNLTPFQIRFEDFRPFFTEGTELFNKAGLFYSRRIGAEPSGVGKVLNFVANNPNYTIEKNPGITRLINATKFSGRTKNNLGIGIFNAVTAPMKARLRNTSNNKDTVILTEPLANYNVLVIDKALKGRSSITFTNTNVMRQGNTRNANVSSLDVSLFDKTNTYRLAATARYSQIWGTQNKYNGYTSSLNLAKVSGLWQYNAFLGVESDKYDPNDIGFLFNNNSFDQGVSISLRYNNPTKKYLSHSYRLNLSNTYLYKPFAWMETEVRANAFFLFKNFWDMQISMSTKPVVQNDFFEARTPGINLKRFAFAYLGISGSTDSRKKWYLNWNIGGAESKVKDDAFYNFTLGVRYRFSDKLQVTSSLDRQQDNGQWGYSHRDNVSTIVTGYNDPIIAFRKLRTNNLIVGAQYNFTARMNWTVRLRHNWTHVENRSFHKLRGNGYWDDIAFANGRNKNFNVFNIDMFYTWDFKWGSRLTLGWKNALGSNINLNAYDNVKYGRNLSAMFSNPHSNELTLKIVYFLDYLDLKTKRKV